jgi:cytochrome c biogenesis protein CcdA
VQANKQVPLLPCVAGKVAFVVSGKEETGYRLYSGATWHGPWRAGSVQLDLIWGITAYQWRSVVALHDFVLALCILLGTLLIPFSVLYQMLRLKRRAIRVIVHATTRGKSR